MSKITLALILIFINTFAHAERVAPVWWMFINGFILLVIIAFFVLLLNGAFKKDKSKDDDT
ncbi:hypothetical protein [Acinetobacter wuhouensis]|nr:hypothetical protein [Acinetobacter wuhouensis]